MSRPPMTLRKVIAVSLAAIATAAMVEALPLSSAAAEDADGDLSHLQAILTTGFADPFDLRAAERHFQAAQSERPDDPRAPYAYALVLLKNHQHAEGVTFIHQAASTDSAYLPAAQALIRESIRLRQYPQAVEQLTALAENLSQADLNPPVPHVADMARWVGMAMEFLSGPLEQTSVRQQARDAEMQIRKLLPPPLRERFERGQLDTIAIVAQLHVEQNAARAQAQEKRQTTEDKTAAKIEEFQSRQQKLLEVKQQQDADAAEIVSDLETALEQAVDRYDTQSKSVSSLLSSIQATQLDMQRMQSILDNQSNLNAGRRRLYQLEILGRSKELDLYLSEYSTAVADREKTARQGQMLMLRWKATNSQVRRAGSEVDARVRKFEQLNERLTKAMQQAKQSTVKTPRIRSVANRMRSFSTYDPFDLDTEQQRLLAEWEAADKQK